MDYKIDDHEGYHLAGRRCRQHDYQGCSPERLQLLEVTLAAGNLTRITGIEFQNGGQKKPD